MKVLTTIQVLLASFCISSSAFSMDIDSASSSSIDFVAMEATVSSRIIHFKWEVEAEINGDYFIIEKSVDEINWIEVRRIQSIENHQEKHTYEISEINFVESSMEYFRILRVDELGVMTELDRTSVNQPVLTNMLLIPSPNKIRKEMGVSYDSMLRSNGEMLVYNESGEVVHRENVHFSKGFNSFSLQIKSFGSGEYKVVLKDQFDNTLSRNLVIHGVKRNTKF